MMKLALINPKVGLFSEYNVIADIARDIPTIGNFTYRDEMTPPEITLLHLAAISREFGYEPSYLDFNLNSEEKELNEVDLAVINLTTHQANEGYRIAKLIKENGGKVGFFGPHATALPKEAIEYGDFVLVSEGEVGFRKYLKDKRDGIYGPYSPLNLDELPTPAYGILNEKNHRIIPLLSSRGCNRGCGYCWQVLTALKKFRTKGVKRLIDDLEYAISVCSGRHFLFVDDNMFIDIKHGHEIVEAILSYNIRWSCQSDISIADDEELLKKMKKAGCMRVLIGFESLCERAMDGVIPFKKKQIGKYSEGIKKIQENGIGVVGSFIIGFDGDTEKEIEKLGEFLEKNVMANVSISILAPPPGTPLFEKLKRENRLITYDWNRYNQCSVVFEPATIGMKELESAVTKLFSLVHSEKFRKRRIKYFIELSSRKI